MIFRELLFEIFTIINQSIDFGTDAEDLIIFGFDIFAPLDEAPNFSVNAENIDSKPKLRLLRLAKQLSKLKNITYQTIEKISCLILSKCSKSNRHFMHNLVLLYLLMDSNLYNLMDKSHRQERTDRCLNTALIMLLRKSKHEECFAHKCDRQNDVGFNLMIVLRYLGEFQDYPKEIGNQISRSLGTATFKWMECIRCLAEIELMLDQRLRLGFTIIEKFLNPTDRMYKNFFDLFMVYLFNLSREPSKQQFRLVNIVFSEIQKHKKLEEFLLTRINTSLIPQPFKNKLAQLMRSRG